MEMTWTEFFFQGCPHLAGLFQGTPGDYDGLQRFDCNGSWTLGKPLRTDMPPKHMIMVLPLVVQDEHSRSQYIAKTVSEYPVENAEAHVRMTGLQNRMYNPADVQKQLDPFLVEARAFEHIQRHCPNRYKPFFPRYFGVLTDIPRKKYPASCMLRRRAVVMETIYPDLASRRMLAAEPSSDMTERLHNALALGLQEKDPAEKGRLGSFEIAWYTSLLNDRLRRITALHDIGLVHGDIRDDHFRLPQDFYDTVLYDFSASYTFSSLLPCRRQRRLLPLSVCRQNEREAVFEIILDRAEKFDFRHHLAQSLDVSIDTAAELCQRRPDETELELIAFRVTNRPDEFAMPSLASIFPFLERIRPEVRIQTWHISRAQVLHRYDCVWIQIHRNEGSGMFYSHVSDGHGHGHGHRNQDCTDTDAAYILILFPRCWDRKEIESNSRLICKRLSGGCGIFTRSDFEMITSIKD